MIGYSQIIEVMAAMLLFSLLLLNVNRAILVKNFGNIESKIEYNAIAMAQNIIGEARALPFDEVTVGGKPKGQILSQLTDPLVLGLEASESYFDDFDDFNGYKDTLDYDGEKSTGLTSNVYFRSVEIFYIVEANIALDKDRTSSATPTKYKKMIVTIRSPYLDDNINAGNGEAVFSHVKSYY